VKTVVRETQGPGDNVNFLPGQTGTKEEHHSHKAIKRTRKGHLQGAGGKSTRSPFQDDRGCILEKVRRENRELRSRTTITTGHRKMAGLRFFTLPKKTDGLPIGLS